MALTSVPAAALIDRDVAADQAGHVGERRVVGGLDLAAGHAASAPGRRALDAVREIAAMGGEGLLEPAGGASIAWRSPRAAAAIPRRARSRCCSREVRSGGRVVPAGRGLRGAGDRRHRQRPDLDLGEVEIGQRRGSAGSAGDVKPSADVRSPKVSGARR